MSLLQLLIPHCIAKIQNAVKKLSNFLLLKQIIVIYECVWLCTLILKYFKLLELYNGNIGFVSAVMERKLQSRKSFWAGVVAQVVENQPSKCEALSSNPTQCHKKKLSMLNYFPWNESKILQKISVWTLALIHAENLGIK
jgi:hypothetical protein